MKITTIKSQVKNPERVSIFIDGKYSFSLSLNQLLEQKLKKGEEIDEVRITELKKLSDEGKIRARAIEWLMGRPHSKKELQDYFYRKKVDTELAKSLIDEFIEKKYLNDEQFARFFADNRLRKHKSVRAITSELRSKGISAEIVSKVVAGLETTDKDALRALITKLRTRPRYRENQKLTAYLISKGFSYGEIKDNLTSEQENTN